MDICEGRRSRTIFSGVLIVLFVATVQAATTVWEVSEEDLKNLGNAFDEASTEFRNSTIVLCTNGTAVCSIVNYINNHVKCLATQAGLLLKYALTDENAFKLLKSKYNNDLDQLYKIVDSFNDTEEISNKYVCLINEKLKQFKTNILESMDLNYIQNRIDICVSEIRKAKYPSALAHFRKISNDSNLSIIIAKAYNGDINNLPKVLRFIKVIDGCKRQEFAYQAIYDIIVSHNHLEHPKVIHFSNVIENCMNVSLKYEVADHSKSIIKKSIYNFDKTYEALDLDKNFDENDVTERFLIYSTLYSELRKYSPNAPQVIGLAYRVKLLDDHCRTSKDLCEHLTNDLTEIKGQFPSGIKALLWNQLVTIENREHPGNKLYSQITFFNVDVVTCPSHICGDNCDNKWAFEPINDGKYFAIKGAHSWSLYNSENKLSLRHLDEHWEVIPDRYSDYYYFKMSDMVISSDIPKYDLDRQCNYPVLRKLNYTCYSQMWKIY